MKQYCASFPCILHAASEHRAWLLYYAIPVLSGILPQCYYENLELLVCSIHILLSDAITRTDLSLAEQMLELFCKHFELLYGIYMTMQVTIV